MNPTGAEAFTPVGLTNDLLLYSLPGDTLRLAGYLPRPAAPSYAYTFCSGYTPRLAVALVFDSPLDQVHAAGYIDEIANAGFFGFSVGSFVARA